MLNVKPRPWWLRPFTAAGMWVTFHPYVYTDQSPLDNYPILLHELVHIKQQRAFGKWKWVWRYCTNKTFRLFQEAEAIVAELEVMTEPARLNRLNWYLEALSGDFYRHCASSKSQASLAIMHKTNYF